MSETNHPVVLISGGAHRIGASIARRLHARGYRIIVHYRSSASAAEKLVSQFNAEQPGSAVMLQAELTQAEELELLCEQAIACFGQLDVLVNNASLFYPTPVGEVTLTQWENLVNTNLRAPFLLAQGLYDSLRQQRGCIVNITDVYGHRPLAQHPVYCMTKAGLIMLTKSLAKEMGPAVRVNAVSPGAIIWPDGELSEERKEEILQSTSLGRVGEAEDIADTVLFLLQSDYITGQVIAVDGGRLMHI